MEQQNQNWSVPKPGDVAVVKARLVTVEPGSEARSQTMSRILNETREIPDSEPIDVASSVKQSGSERNSGGSRVQTRRHLRSRSQIKNGISRREPGLKPESELGDVDRSQYQNWLQGIPVPGASVSN